MKTPMQVASSSPRVGFWSGPFVSAVVLLGIAAVLVGPVASRLHVRPIKKPLPLVRELRLLDERALRPYRVKQRMVLDASIVEALDTDKYIQWVLEDTSVPANDPLRWATLFVTYYTGSANLVLHKPDVCYLGQGYQPAVPHENITVDVPSLAPDETQVPARLLTFAKSAIHDLRRHSVIYTFYCNGGFVGSGDGVRFRVNSLTETYAYFSKVEISFPAASRKEHVAGAAKLFDRVLPELVRHHWPNFDQEEEAADLASGR